MQERDYEIIGIKNLPEELREQAIKSLFSIYNEKTFSNETLKTDPYDFFKK